MAINSRITFYYLRTKAILTLGKKEKVNQILSVINVTAFLLKQSQLEFILKQATNFNLFNELLGAIINMLFVFQNYLNKNSDFFFFF